MKDWGADKFGVAQDGAEEVHILCWRALRSLEGTPFPALSLAAAGNSFPFRDLSSVKTGSLTTPQERISG